MKYFIQKIFLFSRFHVVHSSSRHCYVRKCHLPFNNVLPLNGIAIDSFRGAFDMPVPRGRKFADVVNLCGVRSTLNLFRRPAINTNRAGARGREKLHDFLPRSHSVMPSRDRRARHPAAHASICPDFRRELKVLRVRADTTCVAQPTPTPVRFPVRPPPPHEALFVTRNFPGDVCGRRLSRVSRRRKYFSSSLSRFVRRSSLFRFSIAAHWRFFFTPRMRSFKTRLIEVGRLLEQTRIVTSLYTTISNSGVYSYPRRVSICDPVLSLPTFPHFPREHAAAGKSAKKLIETYLRQGRILKQSEDERGENKDTSVRARHYP